MGASYPTGWGHGDDPILQLHSLSHAPLVDGPDAEEVLHALLQAPHAVAGVGDGDLGALGPLLGVLRAQFQDVARGGVAQHRGSPGQGDGGGGGVGHAQASDHARGA